ncbi:MAG TPA: ATP-binding protein [Verrucomicrobiae bacterium]|nr:ATP-binding protein [Verrucomicrobiae bacterium]
MKSIKRNLAIGFMLGFGLLLGGGGWLIHHFTRNALLARFDAKLRVEALTIITYTRQERDGVDVDFTDRYSREFDDDVATGFFQLWHPRGRTIERSDSLEGKDLPQRFGTLDRPEYWDFILPNGRRGRGIGFQFMPHKSNLNVGLVVAADRSDFDQTLAELRNTLLGAGAIGFVGTLLVITLVLRSGLSPLRRVADQAEQISAATLQTRFPADDLPVELRPICQRLNELLGRLEESFERERRFSADVAHELRTPIAELRSLAEVALKWPGDDKAAAAAFKDTLAIAGQMESVVANLLGIARAEAGKQPVVREAILVAPFVEELWKPFADRAAEKQLDVSFHMPPESRIETDRSMLASILTNLFDNTATYTPRRGSVRIAFRDEQPVFSFVVANTNDNLTPDDIPGLFQRFWRKDTARSSSGHSGLGLPLAKALAGAIGMTLRAELIGKETLAITVEGMNVTNRR